MGRAIAILLLISSLATADERKPKYTHTSAEQGFSVGLPGKPKLDTQKLVTVAGTLQVHTTRYDAGSDLVLSVTFTEYPKDFVKVPMDHLFEGMRKEMAGADGRVLKEEKIELESHPGREWRIEAGKLVVRARVYLVGTKVYQVMINGSKDAVGGSAAEDLFRTFKLEK